MKLYFFLGKPNKEANQTEVLMGFSERTPKHSIDLRLYDSEAEALRKKIIVISTQWSIFSTLASVIGYLIASEMIRAITTLLPLFISIGLYITAKKDHLNLSAHGILAHAVAATLIGYFMIDFLRPFIIFMLIPIAAAAPVFFAIRDNKSIYFWVFLSLSLFIGVACYQFFYPLGPNSSYYADPVAIINAFAIPLTAMIVGWLSSKIYHRAEQNLMDEQAAFLDQSQISILGQMSAGIAHEVNNPLLVISGNTEHLLDLDQMEDLEKRKELAKRCFGKILSQAQRVGQIIANLQYITNQKERQDWQQFNIKTPLLEAYDIVKNRYQRLASAIELPNQKDFLVMGFAGEVTQLFTNLMINALDAVRDETNPRVTIKMVESRDQLKITIEDNGHGIDKKNEGRIGEPFFTTKELGKGTGLGVSLCKQILKQHGSKLILESPRMPTRFSFSLPLVVRKDKDPPQIRPVA